MMLYTKYQGLSLWFQTRRFFMFSQYKPIYVKHVTPGAGLFGPRLHNLTKLGSGQLGNASYQISMIIPAKFYKNPASR